MTDYKEGNHNDFINYLFGQDPKPQGAIVLESPPLEPNKHSGLHIFEQLLMIYVDGLKYFYKDTEGKVDVNLLTNEDILKIQEYFQSMNYKVNIDIFETMYEYQFRYPNYFKDQHKIHKDCLLSDFFYEIFKENGKVFRISFNYL